MKSIRSRVSALALVAVSIVALSACSSGAVAEPEASPSTAATADEGTWPRTVTHEKGETEISAQPERIVSTALSVTGTLLAIDAPVVATSVTQPQGVADENGFLSQWGEVALERDVATLYTVPDFDIEAVIEQDPDLVIVSTSGADSVLDQYEQLAELFPTIVVNYSDKTWQELATQLGEATGRETAAAGVIEDFDAQLAAAAEKITVPEGDVSIVSYSGAANNLAVAKPTSPWAQLFEPLGMRVVAAPQELDTSEQVRQDVAFVTFENATASILGEHVFLLAAEQPDVDAFTAEPTLANLPAVQADSVYPLGPTSFRLDYYSSSALVDTLVEVLATP